ncbi:MAG: hypothetical protein RIG84_02200 [Roseovarius sp.]
MHPIIALWSHPRSMSTATERVMRERGDLAVFHEPFMYDYYVNRKADLFPHFEPEEGHPVTYEDVRDMLLAKGEEGPVFFKDMSYYMMPHMLEDRAFCERLTHCFLIRDPVASIASYVKLDPKVTSEEIGLVAQEAHHKGLTEMLGAAPVILKAEDIRADTRAAIGALWERIGLPPADHAFEWQGEQPEEWKQVEGWHGTATHSKGIRPITPEEIAKQQATFEAMSAEHPQMRAYLEEHLPAYERLAAQALRF